jgi:hypothetical protein
MVVGGNARVNALAQPVGGDPCAVWTASRDFSDKEGPELARTFGDQMWLFRALLP